MKISQIINNTNFLISLLTFVFSWLGSRRRSETTIDWLLIVAVGSGVFGLIAMGFVIYFCHKRRIRKPQQQHDRPTSFTNNYFMECEYESDLSSQKRQTHKTPCYSLDELGDSTDA